MLAAGGAPDAPGAVGVPHGQGARTEREMLLPYCPGGVLDEGCREIRRRFRRE